MRHPGRTLAGVVHKQMGQPLARIIVSITSSGYSTGFAAGTLASLAISNMIVLTALLLLPRSCGSCRSPSQSHRGCSGAACLVCGTASGMSFGPSLVRCSFGEFISRGFSGFPRVGVQ
jgi:hypothetical protein